MQTYRIEFSHLSNYGTRVLSADRVSAASAQEAVDIIRKHYETFLNLKIELVLQSTGSWYIQSANWR